MIKFCGIRRHEDITYMNEFIPDYIGFILAEGYKRTIDIDTAKTLSENLNPYTKKVGVFVNQPIEFIKEAVRNIQLDVIQLHGNEDRQYIENVREIDADIWKAVRAKTSEDIINADSLSVDAILIDSFTANVYGGTGKIADWDLIRNTEIKSQFFLAGGISIGNIGEALKISRNLDISSGIETNGFKDYEKIKNIMKVLRGV